MSSVSCPSTTPALRVCGWGCRRVRRGGRRGGWDGGKGEVGEVKPLFTGKEGGVLGVKSRVMVVAEAVGAVEVMKVEVGQPVAPPPPFFTPAPVCT